MSVSQVAERLPFATRPGLYFPLITIFASYEIALALLLELFLFLARCDTLFPALRR